MAFFAKYFPKFRLINWSCEKYSNYFLKFLALFRPFSEDFSLHITVYFRISVQIYCIFSCFSAHICRHISGFLGYIFAIKIGVLEIVRLVMSRIPLLKFYKHWKVCPKLFALFNVITSALIIRAEGAKIFAFSIDSDQKIPILYMKIR